MLPEKIPLLEVAIGDNLGAGQLLRTSSYEFRYLSPAQHQPSVALLMPASTRLTWRDGDLFPSMDQNLPEGDLFMRIRALFPKQPPTPMHLLALIGRNGIGRLGYRLPEQPPTAPAPPISRAELLKLPFTPQVFAELIRAYLSTGAGIAGVQPKIMVPDRATVPMPSLIVKAAGPSYPDTKAGPSWKTGPWPSSCSEAGTRPDPTQPTRSSWHSDGAFAALPTPRPSFRSSPKP